ncbi:hypothetical protein AMTR_s00009p00089300 [Amborella trichopoda]|uniref:Uncharacterized protein n=1 Tax=Amborella trichopoda TaxID=13333 RepID=W1NGC5_AMBTC|nr:hypothetical protein AMTR_s00009p00089300 [Amborella trichopoda]
MVIGPLGTSAEQLISTICHRNEAEEAAESRERPMTVDEDPETAEKIWLFKSTISANASTLPPILKRLKACFARMEELDR